MSQPSDTRDREIVLSRVFDAPRELVFRVWTDPEHKTHWWGPRGFTTTTHSCDVRPGGEWRFTMHGPDGRDYPNRITYREVVPPERLVYAHGGDVDEDEPVSFVATITFEDEGGKTRLTMRSLFPTAAERDRVVREYGAVEGGKQTLERLAEQLAMMAACEIVSTRVIAVPRGQVFAAFRDPTRLARWWGPQGFTNTFREFDLRPGGAWRFTMHGPDGKDYANECAFVEVVPPERVVFDHLETMHRFRMTITWDAEGGRTRVTWRMRFESPDECAKVRAFVPECNEQNLDRLEAELAT
jgi:uncharacterized protein YndB with AHSA1/START domain